MLSLSLLVASSVIARSRVEGLQTDDVVPVQFRHKKLRFFFFLFSFLDFIVSFKFY